MNHAGTVTKPARVINGPHVRTERTTRWVMLHVAISLVPALLGAVYFFGIRALYLTALSVAVCVLTEYLWQKITKKQITAGDFSAVVTGMLLAFNMPATAPGWVVVLTSVFSILVVKQMFGGIDIKLTTSTIDALCKEAINDTANGVQAADYLISKGEYHSATQRLMEAFFIGEHLAPIKTFPLERKREILKYIRDTDKLINAVKVKHVERAEEILKEIQEYATDFDSGQIEAFIQTSKQLSNLALQKALVAAQTGNQAGVETALQEAVEFWPTNPKIQEFLSTMIGKVDLKDVATTDFDRLFAQKDFRGIFNDRFRFAAALAMDKSRSDQFMEIMKRMETIETSIGQAKELSRLKNNFAAWEIIEKVYQMYPEDQELNRMRSDLTLKASNFAAAISKAEESLQNGDKWEALLGFIRAKQIYPMSSFANDKIAGLAEEILQNCN